MLSVVSTHRQIYQPDDCSLNPKSHAESETFLYSPVGSCNCKLEWMIDPKFTLMCTWKQSAATSRAPQQRFCVVSDSTPRVKSKFSCLSVCFSPFLRKWRRLRRVHTPFFVFAVWGTCGQASGGSRYRLGAPVSPRCWDARLRVMPAAV